MFAGFNDIIKIFQEEECESICDYMKKHLDYPKKAIKNCCEGTEVIRFEVTSTGELVNLQVINSVSSGIDAAVIKLLESTSGMWQPGTNKGQLVDMEKEISIAFKYGETESFATSKDFDQLATLFYEKGNKQLLEKNNPKRALKFYDRGIRYRPNEDCLLLSRGICKYELGDLEGARLDWSRTSNSGTDKIAQEMMPEFSEFKGYTELLTLFEK